MDEMSVQLDDHKIIIKIKKTHKNKKIKNKKFLKKTKKRIKFKETEGLHSGRRSRAPTRNSKT